jgi:hypothetical protein
VHLRVGADERGLRDLLDLGPAGLQHVAEAAAVEPAERSAVVEPDGIDPGCRGLSACAADAGAMIRDRELRKCCRDNALDPSCSPHWPLPSP